MKKNILLMLVVSGILLAPSYGFSAESDVAKTTDSTLAALEPEKSSAAAEVKKADKDAFSEDDFFVEEKKPAPAPVATVSTETPKQEVVSKAKPAAKVQPEKNKKEAKADIKPKAKAGSLAAKPSVKAPEVKKTALSEPKEAPASVLSSVEMEKNWKKLFSKDLTKGSILYTVQSGDSLYVLARKNHTTIDLIKKLNGLKSDSLYPKMKLKIHSEPFSIRVDKSKNTLTLYSGETPVKKYSVATGKKNCTPVGTFKITDKLLNPTWFRTGAILPPGSPENALGTRWMGFDKPSYGIHGTIDPKSIGTQASEGCIRMLNEDVEELYGIVPTGTTVTIQD